MFANRLHESIREKCWTPSQGRFLQFPNAVVLNTETRRNTQMCAKERKRKSVRERKRAQKGAKERKNCKQPGLKQVWELPTISNRGGSKGGRLRDLDSSVLTCPFSPFGTFPIYLGFSRTWWRDSRESSDSHESEIRVIQANRPDGATKFPNYPWIFSWNFPICPFPLSQSRKCLGHNQEIPEKMGNPQVWKTPCLPSPNLGCESRFSSQGLFRSTPAPMKIKCWP